MAIADLGLVTNEDLEVWLKVRSLTKILLTDPMVIRSCLLKVMIENTEFTKVIDFEDEI